MKSQQRIFEGGRNEGSGLVVGSMVSFEGGYMDSPEDRKSPNNSPAKKAETIKFGKKG
jgi:hypothetical protein